MDHPASPPLVLQAFSRESLIASSTVLWAFAMLLIILRTTHRKLSGTKLYADDIAMLLSGVCITIFQAVCVSEAKTGTRAAPPPVAEQASSDFLFTIYISTPIFIVTVGVLRASLLLYWLRLCRSVGPRLNTWATTLKVMAWINGGLTLSGTISALLSCWPISTFWRPALFAAHPEHCVNLQFKFLLGNSINTSINTIIFFAPIPILRACSAMYVTWQKRVALGFLYSVGLSLVVVSILPVITLRLLHIIWLDPKEPTANMFAALIWLVIEVHLGPVVACLPTLMPFYKDVGRQIQSIWTMCTSKRRSQATVATRSRADTAPEAYELSPGKTSQHSDYSFPGPVCNYQDSTNFAGDRTQTSTHPPILESASKLRTSQN